MKSVVTFTRALTVTCLILLFAIQVSAQAPRRNARSRRRRRARIRTRRNGRFRNVEVDILTAADPGTELFDAKLAETCSSEFRTIDGTCTNNRDRLWGSSLRPQLLPGGVSSATVARGDLPSARAVSNVICKQSQDVFCRRGLSELLTFFGQFLDHNLVATPEGEEKTYISVASSDPIFANFSAGLPFKRSERGIYVQGSPREGPINSLPSALDLSAVYGADEDRAALLREKTGGRMLVSYGNLMPFNSFGLSNAPAATADFYVAGDHRANEHPVLTAIHVIFLREHNRLARELEAAFPTWDDEKLYQNARKINGAQFQKIAFDEFYPAMTGKKLPFFRRHRPAVNPTVSAIFSTAAFRVGHTLVGNEIHRVGLNGASMSHLNMMETFFRVENIKRDGIEPYLIGAARHTAQEIDSKIHNNLRDFLFTGVVEEGGFDLAALNIQRGRDHGLPSFNGVRLQYGLRPYTSFSQITRDFNVQSALASVYRTVDSVDPWIGMICEDHVRGGSMGRTMLNVWRDEFKRLRDGDRFYYEIRGIFSREIQRAVPEIRRLRVERDTFSRIIIANSDATRRDLSTSGRGVFYT